MDKSNSMEVLIVKIGSIGDVVMTLGAVQWVTTTYPNARITWVVGEKIVPLLQSTGRIDQIVSVSEGSLFGNSKINSLKTLWGVWKTLFGMKFDLAIVCHKDWRYRLFLLSIRSKEIRIFKKRGGRVFPVPGRYHGNEYLRLVSGMDDRKMPILSFPKIGVPPLSLTLAKILGSKESPWILLVPGSAKNYLSDDPLRRWPVHSYAELAQKLITKGYKVILIGADSDIWVREWFREIKVIDTIAKTGFKDLMALICCSDVLVAHDSGPLHLSILLQKPSVALFGPTDPREKLPQQGPFPIKLLWNGNSLPCSPCYDGKYFAQCDRNVCMEMISVSEVENAIDQFLV